MVSLREWSQEAPVLGNEDVSPGRVSYRDRQAVLNAWWGPLRFYVEFYWELWGGKEPGVFIHQLPYVPDWVFLPGVDILGLHWESAAL